jgi:chorismate synthase
MSSDFGKILRVSVYGESHGKSIGVVINGLPAGEEVDEQELQAFLDRRKPGGSLSTKRKEEDVPVFLSGITAGKTNGAPLCAAIDNQDSQSRDYEALRNVPRPSHADYAAYMKWSGKVDLRGGGHFSGRLTAPLCVAGGIAKQILARQGISIGAHLLTIAGIIFDEAFPLHPSERLFSSIAQKPFPTISDDSGAKMQEAIRIAAEYKDSVGGIIECAAINVPTGLGSPMFEGIENRLAAAIFGIPAVKGIEFGDGFESARQRGSEHNDPLIVSKQGSITMSKNSAGGINGGITNGMPLVFCVAMKPTPSIGKPQTSVNLSSGKETELVIKGRHDPCIAHRAVPVVEAVTALVLLDLLLEEHGYEH